MYPDLRSSLVPTDMLVIQSESIGNLGNLAIA